MKKADAAFVNQAAPTPPATQPAAGLLNVDNIEVGAEVSTSLDDLIDLVTTIQGNQGMPTQIVVDPASWGELRKFQDRDRLQPELARCWHHRRQADGCWACRSSSTSTSPPTPAW